MKIKLKLFGTISLVGILVLGFFFANSSYSSATTNSSLGNQVVSEESSIEKSSEVQPQNALAFAAGAVAGGVLYDAVKAGYNWVYEQSTPGRQALQNADVPAGYKNGMSVQETQQEKQAFGR
ncbi:hypothetical protein [Gracilibacillus suaedae]|uniref:hypothetical protein n=1 Tax=Gracilibacillus suaedae TaxID=2820273 RepID=UPI001ABDCC08|nr:hypothetical protein [Gracilibacillus suaedae]